MTPAPISVERLADHWREAAEQIGKGPSAAAFDVCANELDTALPALLHQLAETERDRDEWKARESFAVSDLQRELRQRDSKLAEREAEVERLLRGVREMSGRFNEAASDLRAAERAREESRKLLKRCEIALRIGECDMSYHDEQGVRRSLQQTLAAFLAASGGA